MATASIQLLKAWLWVGLTPIGPIKQHTISNQKTDLAADQAVQGRTIRK